MANSYTSRLGNAPEEAVKAPVVAVVTTNITLSGTQTVSGVPVVAGDRVAVNGQTDSAQNGIYDVSESAWTRAKDFNAANDVTAGLMVLDTNTDSLYRVVVTGAWSAGVTPVSFLLVTNSTIVAETINASQVVGRLITLTLGSFKPGVSGVLVFQNGQLLYEGIDYTTPSGTEILLTNAPLPADVFSTLINVAPTAGTSASAVALSLAGGVATNVEAYMRTLIASGAGFGMAGDGVTDNYAAIVNGIARGSLWIGQGVFYCSQSIVTSAAESDAVDIRGAGWSKCILAFDRTNGLELNATGHNASGFTIIDRAAFTTPVTTLALFHSQLPQRALIQSGLVGLNLDRNNSSGKEIQVMGFGDGVFISNTKFYMTLTRCRSHFNLKGLVVGTGVDAPNFTRSIACYYNSNFEKNLEVNSGFHHLTDCSLELCEDYNVNNANYPNGGVHIPGGGFAIFDHCYIEEANFFNANPKTVVRNPANIWAAVVFAPTRFESTHFGNKSRNLVPPPWVQSWSSQAADSVLIDNNVANLSDDKRYTRLTAQSGVGVAKVVRSMFNNTVRGLTPSNTPDISFKLYVGFWVRVQATNFSAGFPFFRVQLEDKDGALFYAESPTRTMIHAANAFDNSSAGNWQYVGALFPIRDTLTTGEPLSAARLEITVEEADTNATGANRVLDIAEVEFRVLYANEGAQVIEGDAVQTEARELTISSGQIVVTDGYHTVDTEADAATDDLDSIDSDNFYIGKEVVLCSANNARTVVVKDGTGNLNIDGDFTLNNVADTIRLVWTGTEWRELSRSSNA